MSRAHPSSLARVLPWFAVTGAPFAFAAMHVTGIGLNLWRCNAAGERTPIPVDLWTAVLTGAAAGIALAGWASAILVFFATRDADSAPPEGRIHFMATLGTALSPLFLFIILMSGLGTIALPTCHQS